MEEDAGSVSTWKSLPRELLSLVLSRLLFSDLTRAAAVCIGWCLSAAEDRRHELPWAWLKDTRMFYSFSERRVYNIDLPDQLLVGRHWDAEIDGIHGDWFTVLSSSPTRPADGQDFYLFFLYHPSPAFGSNSPRSPPVLLLESAIPASPTSSSLARLRTPMRCRFLAPLQRRHCLLRRAWC